MNISYDKEADAAYITLLENIQSNKTYGEWPFHIDVAVDSSVIGLEIMDASKVLNENYISKIIEQT